MRDLSAGAAGVHVKAVPRCRPPAHEQRSPKHKVATALGMQRRGCAQGDGVPMYACCISCTWSAQPSITEPSRMLSSRAPLIHRWLSACFAVNRFLGSGWRSLRMRSRAGSVSAFHRGSCRRQWGVRMGGAEVRTRGTGCGCQACSMSAQCQHSGRRGHHCSCGQCSSGCLGRILCSPRCLA